MSDKVIDYHHRHLWLEGLDREKQHKSRPIKEGQPSAKHLPEYFLVQPAHPPHKTHPSQPQHTDTDFLLYYPPDTLWLAPDTLWQTGNPSTHHTAPPK